MCSEDDYEKLSNNILFIDKYTEEVITYRDVVNKIEDLKQRPWYNGEYDDVDLNNESEVVELVLKGKFDDICTLDNYCNDSNLDYYSERKTTPQGETVYIFGLFGMDY